MMPSTMSSPDHRSGCLCQRGRVGAACDIVCLLEALITPGDRVTLEGNNQMDLRGTPRGRPAYVMEVICPPLMMQP
jgi:hypothetical protein